VRSATYQLAHAILIENYKLEQMAVKEIVLSRGVTGLRRRQRERAVANLVRLKLIRVRQSRPGVAARVVKLLST
jgi:hypothetical protein